MSHFFGDYFPYNVDVVVPHGKESRVVTANKKSMYPELLNSQHQNVAFTSGTMK